MTEPLYIAKERFDPASGETWDKYVQWAKIPGLTEIVSLDTCLCPRLLNEVLDEDWAHIVNVNFRLDYFCHLDYLLKRIGDTPRRNIFGLYRNSNSHIVEPPPGGDFSFIGYDLIEEATQISALNNCGGFPLAFRNEELNQYGVLATFDRAAEVRQELKAKYPEESHADCELYAIWRLNEAN